MAKKKLEVFEKAGENYFIVGEVKNASKEEKTSKDGNTTYDEYRMRIKTPEGVTVFVKTNRFTPKDGQEEHAFVTEKYNDWDEMCDMDFENEKKFVYFRANKSEDKKMYNWFTNFEKEDGQISYNLEALPIVVDHAIDDEEKAFLNFQNGASHFDDRKTVFRAKMYVAEIEGQKLLLTDGKEEYPNTLSVELEDGMDNKAVLGQGYEFRLKLVKGKKSKVESGTANWGEEENSGGYDPDKLIVEAVEGVIKDMTLGKVVKSKKAVVESDEDELPF